MLKGCAAEWPLGPYPEARTFTIFVERQIAGNSVVVREACIQVAAKADFFRVRVKLREEASCEARPMPVSQSETVVDAARRIIDSLRRREH